MKTFETPMRKLFSAALVLFITISATAQITIDYGSKSPLRKLQIAEMAISNLYVDSVDEQKLVEDGIRGMLEKLDPHSSYATPKEVQALNEPLQGNFEGIGVQFNMIEDTLVVIQPVRNGPSEKVGINAGDRIVTVNDSVIAGVKMPRQDIMKRLRGKKGTKVRLGIMRRGIKDRLNFVVERAKIPVHTIDAVYMIKPGTGYIRIGNFGATTYSEFMSAMDSLRAKGMKDLILDLQENGGGYLQSAVQIANEFLPGNELIVYTKGLRIPRQEYKAIGNGSFKTGKVVVLIDEFTASAAEIVTGAIQDHDRGMVVGRRSFGKGLVQRPIDLPDGSMIRLTIAHYYTPTGRCIQKPYKKGDLKDYEMDLENRLKRGELTNRDSIHFDDSLKYKTLRLNRTVYGGGGIMPDFFVPLDTMKFTRLHRQLAAKSILINADLKYMDKNRKEFKKRYSTFEQFEREFEVPQSLIDEIFAEGLKQNIKPKDDAEIKQTTLYMKAQIKALIARDLWDMSEYFRIMNENSDVVKKALEIIGDPNAAL